MLQLGRRTKTVGSPLPARAGVHGYFHERESIIAELTPQEFALVELSLSSASALLL